MWDETIKINVVICVMIIQCIPLCTIQGVFIQLINNQLGQGCPQMTLTSEQTMHHHNIVGLLLHFLITIPTNGDNRLLDLFTQIIHAPDKVQV